MLRNFRIKPDNNISTELWFGVLKRSGIMLFAVEIKIKYNDSKESQPERDVRVLSLVGRRQHMTTL